MYQLIDSDPLFFNFSSHFTDTLIDDVCLQSMLGRKMLEFQLRRLGAFDAEETISSHPNLDESFKLCEKFLISLLNLLCWIDIKLLYLDLLILLP